MTLLMLACCFGNLRITQIILMNKTTVKDRLDKMGQNSLFHACLNGHHHIVKELGIKDVPYVVPEHGETSLHVAA